MRPSDLDRPRHPVPRSSITSAVQELPPRPGPKRGPRSQPRLTPRPKGPAVAQHAVATKLGASALRSFHVKRWLATTSVQHPGPDSRHAHPASPLLPDDLVRLPLDREAPIPSPSSHQSVVRLASLASRRRKPGSCPAAHPFHVKRIRRDHPDSSRIRIRPVASTELSRIALNLSPPPSRSEPVVTADQSAAGATLHPSSGRSPRRETPHIATADMANLICPLPSHPPHILGWPRHV